MLAGATIARERCQMSRKLRTLRSKWKELLGGAVAIVVVVVVFFFILPGIADPRDVWDAVKLLSWAWIAALAVAAILNVLTFPPQYMAVLPGLRFRPALAVTTASTASTYVAPGGFAVGVGLSFAMLRGWGFRAQPVTLAISLITIWNQFMVFGTPIVAVTLLSATGGSNPLLQTSAYIGLAVFLAIVVGCVLALSTRRLAQWLGDFVAATFSAVLAIIRRGPVAWSGEALVQFRDEALGLLRARWHVLTLATLAGHLTTYLVLIVALRALGVTGDEVSVAESFAAWALIRVLGSIPLTPGGFGIVELGMTGALVGFGGSSVEVVAVVLVYRFLTVAPPVVLGALFGATWRRHNPDPVSS